MRKHGLEWLWRIKEEPSLFRRYCHDGAMLIWLLMTRIIPLAATIRWRKLWRRRHDFVIVADDNDRGVTLRISGHAVASEAPRAVGYFREVVARGKSIEVDLSSTRSIDSRFLGLLLMLRKQVKERENILTFAPLPAKLQRQFKLAGVDYLLSSS
jgi:N-acetylglucosaminyldiphosphoundecaprenol N-acetyl-beta-D-mannosaminyltransferase